MERIELLHAHDRGIVDLVFLPVFGEVVVDLAGTEDQALGERGGRLRSASGVSGSGHFGSSMISGNAPT